MTTSMPDRPDGRPREIDDPAKHPAATRLKRLLTDQRSLFLFVGAANTLFATLLFSGLVLVFGAGVPSVVSLVMAWAVSLLTGFFAHRILVFRVSGRMLPDFLRYASVTYVSLLINIGALALLADVMGLPPIPVQIGIVLFAVLFNYFGHKFFSFRRKP